MSFCKFSLQLYIVSGKNGATLLSPSFAIANRLWKFIYRQT